ncbi:ferredoxin--NADP reductase [Bryobacter aggregatus]|uniref:ferredoxin--NADP reductase n=1 Tax=Bryobacter aggregatus TaxID=360054 RepID=UPI0004E1C344|nr:FAD-dependent oxidoreductase [Bryobacter aggregatus]
MALVEYKARLVEIRDLGPGIRHFRFELPDTELFEFVPGQWVSMTELVDGKKTTRAYSIASLPGSNQFEICLNKVDDGVFSPHLFSLQPGDLVPTKGPVGSFVLKSKEREAIFVATGTGVVPFRPMLRQVDYLEHGVPATLIFGARYTHGLMFHDEFQALAERHPNLHYIPTVTRPEGVWAGKIGRVQPLLWEVIGDRTDLDVYVCGLKEMVESVRDELKARGFDRKQIIVEKYD